MPDPEFITDTWDANLPNGKTVTYTKLEFGGKTLGKAEIAGEAILIQTTAIDGKLDRDAFEAFMALKFHKS